MRGFCRKSLSIMMSVVLVVGLCPGLAHAEKATEDTTLAAAGVDFTAQEGQTDIDAAMELQSSGVDLRYRESSRVNTLVGNEGSSTPLTRVGSVEALMSDDVEEESTVLQAQGNEYPDGPYTSGAITFYLNSDRSKARITGYEIGDAVSITLPSALNGISVAVIGEGVFKNAENLEQVIIRGSVTSIEGNAFNGCKALQLVELPNTVTAIGDNAFESCEKLATMRTPGTSIIPGTVRLPAQLEELGSYSFKDCAAISALVVPKSLASCYAWADRNNGNDYKGPFYGCGQLSQVSFEEGAESVCGCLLAGCPGVKKVVALAPGAAAVVPGAVALPASVERIGNAAFANCENLASVQLPGGVKAVKEKAFQQCGNLVSVTLSEVLETIGSSAFEDCSSLKAIDIPFSTKQIDSYAFRNCTSLATVTIHGDPVLAKVVFEGCVNAKFVYTIHIDNDGDGLPDEWEQNGVTFDGEFIDLPAMGADPNKKDLFIEVDWMVAPSSWVAWYGLEPSISLAPSDSALKLVHNAFAAHDISLHVDAGPNSVMVYGTASSPEKKWGSLSGGNEVPYQADFPAEKDHYKHWDKVVSENFSSARSHVFRHCLFVDMYDGGDSTGFARSIPGQYFLVANHVFSHGGNNVYKAGLTATAGTFMHELGHTLGLRHGGNDDIGLKPNYLSVMNYWFQAGLPYGSTVFPSYLIDYSNYKLPDLNEWHIDENAGVDPDGQTSDVGFWTRFSKDGSPQYVYQPVAECAYIDFNQNGIVESAIIADLNGDGKMTVLEGWRDWGNLQLKAGAMGTVSGSSAGVSSLPEGSAEAPHEATVEELLDVGAWGAEGAGSIERVSAMTVLAGTPGQSMRLRVTNLGPVEAAFRLDVQGDALAGAFSRDITLAGSVGELSCEYVSVPLPDSLVPGSYTVTACLSYQGLDDVVQEFPVEAYQPTDEEKRELLAAIDGGELDGMMSSQAVEELKDVLSGGQGGGGQGGQGGTKSDLSTYRGRARGAHPDLADSDWYMKVPDGAFPGTDVLYLDYTLYRGLMSGYTDGTNRFDPWGGMSRAMALTVIYRMATGATAATTDNDHADAPFTDVRPGDWYAAAAAWGYDHEITTGYTDGTGRFGPNDPVTREQLATMIARYCEKEKGMPASDGDVSMFKDRAKIQDWALDGVAFCYAHEIVSGMGNTGNFAPGDVALRCQMAKIIAVTARMLE